MFEVCLLGLGNAFQFLAKKNNGHLLLNLGGLHCSFGNIEWGWGGI